jgi:hypothetical protein
MTLSLGSTLVVWRALRGLSSGLLLGVLAPLIVRAAEKLRLRRRRQ